MASDELVSAHAARRLTELRLGVQFEPVSQVSTDTTLALMDAEAVGVRVFSDLAEATTWLRQRPHRA